MGRGKKQRHEGPCSKCGTHRWTLHRDHIVPTYKGGSDDESNIQWLCANCHEDKTREDMKGNVFGIGNAGNTKPMSEETKRIIGESSRGRKYSDEARRKISEAKTGFRYSPEQRKKLSESAQKRVESQRLVEYERQLELEEDELARKIAELEKQLKED